MIWTERKRYLARGKAEATIWTFSAKKTMRMAMAMKTTWMISSRCQMKTIRAKQGPESHARLRKAIGEELMLEARLLLHSWAVEELCLACRKKLGKRFQRSLVMEKITLGRWLLPAPRLRLTLPLSVMYVICILPYMRKLISSIDFRTISNRRAHVDGCRRQDPRN